MPRARRAFVRASFTLMKRFFQVTLRTQGVEKARAFYAAVLGAQTLDVVELHEGALARGARPHWLGFLDVGEVDKAAEDFKARGATAYGPKWVNPAGLEAAVLRDPGGAMVALAKPGPAAPRFGPEIAQYVLNTQEVEKAKANYGALAGWVFEQPEPLLDLGTIHPFAWEAGGPRAGAMIDVAGREGVHPHWLFHFRVAKLTAALEAVRANGGKVLGPWTLPGGARVAVCDDAQGAAFGLQEENA
jgi:uncharacterized protein